MFSEPPPSPYDVKFRLFGFPVRIHPLFWLGTVLLGSNTLQGGPVFLLVWVVVVLVSLLVHELGHALAYRRYGVDSHIVLWMFGGLAVGNSTVNGRGRRIFVSLAGPLAGFALCGLVYGTHKLTGWGSPANGLPIAYLCWALIIVNLYWNILNLLPVFPLDGGKVSVELCEAKWRGRGLQMALKISIGVAAAIAAYSLITWFEMQRGGGPLTDLLPWWFPKGDVFLAVLFILLALQSYQLLQQVGRGYYYEAPDDRVPWEK